MGRPMAERLLAAGHELTVYNRTAAKAQPLADQGAKMVTNAGEAVAASELTILMLKDAEATRSLLFGGGAPIDFSGRTLLQMGTIAPHESQALMEEIHKAGGQYLEAPVLGSRPQAKEGKLLVMVGATPEQFNRWEEVLRCFGPVPRLVGPVGHAAALKLALNQLIASQLTAFSLSLAMARRRGIDLEVFMDILRHSALYAPTFDSKLPSLLAREFSHPNFPVRLLLKDVDLALAEAKGLGLDPTSLEGVREVVRKAIEQGFGEHDYAGLYQVVDPA